MPNVKRIVVQFDEGAEDLIVPIGPAKPAVTPFAPGGVKTDAPVAPTPAQYNADPSAYDWMEFDLLRQSPPPRWFDPQRPEDTDDGSPGAPGSYVYLTALENVAAWFAQNREQAQRWWTAKYGTPLNTAKLGPMQRKKTKISA